MDTHYSSDHTLALAQRDSGAFDTALQFFLDGEKIDDVIDPEKINVDLGGAFYGNIGRCLHLMGQVETALICYRKSAGLVEQEQSGNTWENQAYIRQWIEELLLSRQETEAALSLLVAAFDKWTVISPPKARRMIQFIADELGTKRANWPDAATAERFALRWISQATW